MSLSGVSLRDLEYVVTIAELGSFVKAAERCHVSQPSLSVQVRKLEARLGTVIFERTTRRLIVTPIGQQLIDQMRKVLHEAHILIGYSGRTSQPFGRPLRLSAIATLGPYFFPHVLRHLRAQYPDVPLVLGEGKTDDLVAGLIRGELDAVLMSAPVNDEGLMQVPLFTEPFFMACPAGHPAGASGEAGWVGLPSCERLLLEEGHCLRDQAIAACADVAPAGRHATGLETLKYMVAAGEGCTLVPALAVTPRDDLQYVPIEAPEYCRTIVLAWRQSDPRGDEFAKLAQHLKAFRHPAIDQGPISQVPA